MNKNKIQSIFNNYIVKPALGLGLIYSFSSCRPQTAEERSYQESYKTKPEQTKPKQDYNGFKLHYIGDVMKLRGKLEDIEHVRVADMNGDGKLDIIIITDSDRIAILENQLPKKTEAESTKNRN